MFDKPKKLGIFSESGPLIALAVAAGILLGLAGPSWAQFFNNYGGYQQRPQPQRGGGGFGGGWGGRRLGGRRLVRQRQFWASAAGAAASLGAAAASGTARARGFFKGAAARETRNRSGAPHPPARRCHGGLARPWS